VHASGIIPAHSPLPRAGLRRASAVASTSTGAMYGAPQT
jgi:hypothetical protein